MKLERTLYIVFPILTACFALCLQIISPQTHEAFSPLSNNPNAAYIMAYITGLSFIVGVWLAVRKQVWNAVLRMLLLLIPAWMVLLDYYVFMDANLLYALPLIGVAYLFVWPKDKGTD